MKKIVLYGLILYLILLIFSRFYNLEYTARFTEDESGFLVRVHGIYVARQITLVGQISELGTKVFSSLSVYLLMPFAILGKFDPVSTFYGAAFFGVMTSLAMLYLTYKLNKHLLILASVLTLIWFPLVQTGRWAWNPNFIPLWITLALICYLYKKPMFYFLAGIFLGLSVHQHYYAIFASLIFILIICVEALTQKQFKKIILVNLGFALLILPFIIFDLRHPPGIFILGAAKQAQSVSISLSLTNFFNYTGSVFNYYAQSSGLSLLLVLITLALIAKDLVNKEKSLFFLVPAIFQILMISLIGSYYFHYFFAIIPFFYTYLIFPRKGTGRKLSILALVILIIGSLPKIYPHLTITPVEPDLTTVKKLSSIIHDEILDKKLQNVNLAVLASPDHTTHARKYRDLLLVPDNINVMTRDNYFTNDVLFVISTSNEQGLRKDPAAEMDRFRNGVVKEKWQIENSPWRLYLFAKY